MATGKVSDLLNNTEDTSSSETTSTATSSNSAELNEIKKQLEELKKSIEELGENFTDALDSGSPLLKAISNSSGAISTAAVSTGAHAGKLRVYTSVEKPDKAAFVIDTAQKLFVAFDFINNTTKLPINTVADNAIKRAETLYSRLSKKRYF